MGIMNKHILNPEWGGVVVVGGGSGISGAKRRRVGGIGNKRSEVAGMRQVGED